jgi:outer membrane lipoprotein-sorting protein
MMNTSVTYAQQQLGKTPNAVNTSRAGYQRTLLLAAAILTAAVPAIAQAGGGAGAEVQEKLAAVKQSTAENQQKLHGYQWTETTQLALKGDPKPPSQASCVYGPDGKVQKTPLTAPPPPPSGGRMKQKVIANKKEEMKDYMGQVKVLLAKYVPPDPQSMQQAFQGGKVSLVPNPSSGVTQMVFKDYALPGDQMTLSFDTAAKKISTVKVDTYLDDPKDAVTLAVQFASLPDSTNYVQQTVLDATAKKLVVTTTNSDYKAIGH